MMSVVHVYSVLTVRVKVAYSVMSTVLAQAFTVSTPDWNNKEYASLELIMPPSDCFFIPETPIEFLVLPEKEVAIVPDKSLLWGGTKSAEDASRGYLIFGGPSASCIKSETEKGQSDGDRRAGLKMSNFFVRSVCVPAVSEWKLLSVAFVDDE